MPRFPPNASQRSPSSVCYYMGMCSRQERIQKDVDIVIQRCKAEKESLFSGKFPLSLIKSAGHVPLIQSYGVGEREPELKGVSFAIDLLKTTQC